MLKFTQNKTLLLSALLPMLSAVCVAQDVPVGAAAVPALKAPAAKMTTPAPQPVAAVPQAAVAAHPLPAPTALEIQTGIQITHVGVTAQGGLVDMRFKVLDAAKAKTLFDNPANVPMLISGDLPPLNPPRKALHGAKYGQGQVVYILYPNLRRAIKPGAEVAVALGDVRLGPMVAQ